MTLKELSKRLNLSVSTVSKALRDSYEIKQETKDRVLKLAKELNYQPNLFASNLRSRKSQTIGIIVPEVASNFFSLVLDGIQSVAKLKEYHVLIYVTHDDYNTEVSIFQHLEKGRVDGLIMSPCQKNDFHDHILNIMKDNISVVFFDRFINIPNCPTIKTNNYESAYLATQHLIESKCKKIYYLSIGKLVSINQERLKGFCDALKAHDHLVSDEIIVQCTDDPLKDYRIIKSLLKNKKPDAIFASVEKLAITTYSVCKELEINIPGSVKVISFSNLKTASLLDPPLTTITQPAFDIGKEACGALLRKMEKKVPFNRTEHIEIKSELIIRESTLAYT